ncbi:MAG: BACON domain-containing protein [Rikenellaceae bacterium]|nr:BACON domain-containing protein [Rikenellaceae bacterium]
MKKILFILGCSALTLFSCDNKNLTQESVLENGIGAVSSISEVDIPPFGDTLTFSITTNTPWVITTDDGDAPSWIVFNTSSGKAGTTNITMRVGENDDPKNIPSRAETIYIKCSDDTFETIEVRQERPYVKVTPERIDFGWDHYKKWGSEPLTFRVESNVGWTVTDITAEYTGGQSAGGLATDQWLICPDKKEYNGRGDAELSFMTRRYNILGVDNQTVLKVTRETTLAKEESVIVILIQDSRRFIVVDEDGTPDRKIELEACNNEDAIISVDTEAGWKSLNVNSTQWVEIVDFKGEVGKKDLLKINAGANPMAEQRIEEVVILASEDNVRMIPDTIWVSQKGYVFTTNTTSMTFENNNATARNMVLSSSGRWSVDSVILPKWMVVTPSNGTANTNMANVTLCPNSQNLEFEDRKATVTFQTDEPGNDMTQSVEVSQAAYLFDAEVANKQISTVSTSNNNLSITSSGDWSVGVDYTGSNEKDWLNISKLTGSGNETITYNAIKENTSQEHDKTAHITIFSDTHENAGVDYEPIEFDIIQPKYTFITTPEEGHEYEFAAVPAGVSSLEINCTVPWEITTTNGWIKVSPNKGDGNGKVKVSIYTDNNVKEGERDSERNGSIKVTSKIAGTNIHTKTFDVKQKAFVFNTSTTGQFDKLPAVIPSKYTVDVKCSGPWKVVVDKNTSTQNWIKADKTSGNGNATVTFTVAHGEAQARSAEVSIISTLTEQSSTYKFSQEAYILKADKMELPTFKPTGAVGQTISVTCSGQWRVASKPEWITVNPNDVTNGNGSFTVTAVNNTKDQVRTGTIKVQSVENSQLSVSINVSQEAYYFNADKTTLDFTALKVAEQKVDVTCTGQWKATCDADWITITPTGETSGNGSLTVNATNNTETKLRKATIRVESVDNKPLALEITVTQEAYVFKVDKTALDFTVLNAVPQTVGVTCTGDWKVASKPDWITTTIEKENAGITVKAINNTATELREGVIKVESVDNAQLVLEIKVTQAAYVFEVDKKTLEFQATDAAAQTVGVTCTGKWKVASKPAWVTITPATETNGNGSFTVTSANNTTTEPREGVVKVESVDNAQLVLEINVSQEKRVVIEDEEKDDNKTRN